MKQEGWYIPRPYAHFDRPLPFDVAKAYVTDPVRVQQHSFHPFIDFEIVQRRYKVRGQSAEIGSKRRPIGIPSHVDGYVFAYYAKMLGERYEEYLVGNSLGECVLAYRRGLGSNIDFANAAFDEIGRRNRCMAMAFDLEKFFETIDHEILKRNWARLLGVERLSPDRFALFSAITRHASVNLEACRERLQIPKNANLPRPICTPSVFRNVIRRNKNGRPNLIHTNKNTYGIPQGSQISALLSNIYMLDFDLEMKILNDRIGAYYRRYSDDILWICEPEAANDVAASLRQALAKLGGTTTLNEKKTESSTFRVDAFGRLECDRPIQYLGFVFDGTKIRIRSQTLSRFWRRVVYATRATTRAARHSTVKPGTPYKRQLFRRFSHLGHRNLISYAQRSERVMKTGAIRKQLSRHMPRLLQALGRRPATK
jgi:RNA-directed DNA polymerase